MQNSKSTDDPILHGCHENNRNMKKPNKKPLRALRALRFKNEVKRYQRYRGETLLYTGDLFRKDRDGYLYFVARMDDLIKTGGERVSPKEIENAIQELNGIEEIAVVGVPDEILGQAIKVFIVTNGASNLTEHIVMRYCKENLEPFMLPKYVEFRASLPKLTSGKIARKKLL